MKFFDKVPTVKGLPKLTTARYLPEQVRENIKLRDKLLHKYKVKKTDFNEPEGVDHSISR